MKVVYEKKTDNLYYWNDNNLKIALQCGAHLHYYVEIVYIKEGCMRAYIDADGYDVREGDMLVVFPNKIHRFDELGKKCRYELFIVNPDIVPELTQKISSENPENPVIQDVEKNQRLLSLIKILSEAPSFPSSSRDMLIKGYFLSFFAEIFEMMPMRNNSPDENQAMRLIMQYCSQNFTRDLSLSLLENELHLSKYYISHLFSSKLGLRFNDYINSLRISESCRLLKMSDMNITEISSLSGFGTSRTFNRAFIKQMKISPSEYRKNSHGEDMDVSLEFSDANLIFPGRNHHADAKF